MGPQSSNFGMNAHLGLVNANVAAQQSKSGLSKQMPNVTQQLQGQLPLMNSFGFAQQAQTQNFNAPTSANTQVNSLGSCILCCCTFNSIICESWFIFTK